MHKNLKIKQLNNRIESWRMAGPTDDKRMMIEDDVWECIKLEAIKHLQQKVEKLERLDIQDA